MGSQALQDTGVLYKYMGVSGAKKTLASGGVRFSRPVDFNDPFDMQLEEALGAELEQFLPHFREGFHQFLSGDIHYSSLRDGQFRDIIILVHQGLKAATPEQLEAIKKELMAEPIEAMFNVDRLHKANREQVEQIHNSMQSCGVFCSTKKCDSLLMWAHYAQSHEVVVLQFSPDTSKDSFFIASRPVQYVKERPLLYRSAAEFVRHALCMPLFDSAKDILERLTYSKSEEWAYEEEYRLVIPRLVAEGQRFATLRFWDHELSAIFLGCRMSSQDKVEIIALGKRLNPKLQVYQAVVSRREFALSFHLVD
jgi:hypothetical protein